MSGFPRTVCLHLLSWCNKSVPPSSLKCPSLDDKLYSRSFANDFFFLEFLGQGSNLSCSCNAGSFNPLC